MENSSVVVECSCLISSLPVKFPVTDGSSFLSVDRKEPFMLKSRQRYISSAMSVIQASVIVLLCISWTSAIPKPPARHFGSGAGEIPRVHGAHWPAPPFVDSNGPETELFDDYDAEPHRGSKVPSEYDVREKDTPEEHPDQTPDEPPFEVPYDEWPHESGEDEFKEKDEEEDTKPHELEKAMGHAFRQTLEEASLLNKTYANTTEEDVEFDGRKFHVQKSVIEMGDADKNETLLIETISSVNEDEPKLNRTERSNPDAEPYQ
ncbi:uncharacterized protein TNCT_261001 [Trichonephila clavata]|uniref:Uncharacterized protein n=1 Tax=Trichonephila clavata TaxID=2740835 RepID=A0A8X6KHH1_TRICU|nr:uncharacterized protein TNCT_261001 [Trichonephila clavata]